MNNVACVPMFWRCRLVKWCDLYDLSDFFLNDDDGTCVFNSFWPCSTDVGSLKFPINFRSHSYVVSVSATRLILQDIKLFGPRLRRGKQLSFIFELPVNKCYDIPTVIYSLIYILCSVVFSQYSVVVKH